MPRLASRQTVAWSLAALGTLDVLVGITSFFHVRLPWYGVVSLVSSGPLAAGGAALALVRPRYRGAVALGARVVEFAEKDPDYRKPLIRALTR